MSRPVIRPGSGASGPLEETLDLACDGHPVVLGILEAAPRVRVGVGAAADGHQRDRPGMRAFDRLAGVARPVAAELVEVAAERGAVAGVVNQHGPHRAIGGGDAKHGERVIDGSAGIGAEEDALVARFAAIDREAGGPLGPGESSRAAAVESGTRDLLDLVGQLAGVAVDPLLLLGGHRLAEDQGEDARQGGTTVGMRRADHEPFAGESGLFLEPPRDLLGHVRRGRRSCRP